MASPASSDVHVSIAGLDKTYRPADIETKHYQRWEHSGAFRAGRNRL